MNSQCICKLCDAVKNVKSRPHIRIAWLQLHGAYGYTKP